MIHASRLLLKVITVVSLLDLAVNIQQSMYQNVPRGDLSFECHSGYGLSNVASSYVTRTGPARKRNVEGDRLWMWECIRVLLCSQIRAIIILVRGRQIPRTNHYYYGYAHALGIYSYRCQPLAIYLWP